MWTMHTGRYRYRVGPKLARLIAGATDEGLDGGEDLATPGWKIMHVPDFDFGTSCNTLSSCLRPVAEWSTANPRHTPLFVTLELKVGQTAQTN